MNNTKNLSLATLEKLQQILEERVKHTEMVVKDHPSYAAVSESKIIYNEISNFVKLLGDEVGSKFFIDYLIQTKYLNEQHIEEKIINVKAKMLTGKSIIIKGLNTRKSTVEDLLFKIQDTEGIPPDQMKIIFGGKQLDPNDKIGYYNLEEGSEVYIVLKLRNIGLFVSGDSTVAGETYLKMKQSNTYEIEEESEDVKKFIKDLNGDPEATFQIIEKPEFINEENLNILKRLADERFEVEKNNLNEIDIEDFQIKPSRNDIQELIGKEAINGLEALFEDSYDKIIIRRCTAYGKFISFHTDSSQKTMQMTLNGDNEYEGGRLIFACEGGKLKVPTRSAGCITIHDNTIVHGVSELKSGIRYGLYFLKE